MNRTRLREILGKVKRGELAPEEAAGRLKVSTVRITWATVLKKNAQGTYSYHSEQRFLPVHEHLAGEDEGARFAAEWSLKGLDVALNPVVIEVQTMSDYVGLYGPRQISLEEGVLYYQREDRPRYRLIPMGDDMFGLDGLDRFRIQFERQAGGVVYRLVGMYDNGQSDQHDRVES